MNAELVVERLMQTLVSGNRRHTRQIVEETRAEGVSFEEITHEIYWPALNMVTSLFSADQLTTLAHHYAARMLRCLVDQAQTHYARSESRDRKILLFSGPGETDELAGQIVCDLAEAAGYEVLFGGGGVANDEILEEVGQQRPDILLMFASAPSDAPNIRLLIDSIRGVAACPHMQIVVGGGVFQRAEGLAAEIGADLWADTPSELLEVLDVKRERRAAETQRTVGRTRQRSRSAA